MQPSDNCAQKARDLKEKGNEGSRSLKDEIRRQRGE